MNMIGFWISFCIFFIYFIYLMITLNPEYKRSKEEETIAIYLGIIILCLVIVFLILYLISELL